LQRPWKLLAEHWGVSSDNWPKRNGISICVASTRQAESGSLEAGKEKGVFDFINTDQEVLISG